MEGGTQFSAISLCHTIALGKVWESKIQMKSYVIFLTLTYCTHLCSTPYGHFRSYCLGCTSEQILIP